MTTNPVYPHIHMKVLMPLSAMPLLSAIAIGTALAQGGVRARKINRILNEVAACEPDQLLATASKYVHVTEGWA